MATYLDAIVAEHREKAALDVRPLALLADEARRAGPPRPFTMALSERNSDAPAVIAEVKRRSPMKGPLALTLDPAEIARAYVEGGATCLSVLTDVSFFDGSAADLQGARGAVGLPVLRKDFTVSERDVYDARIMGADAILLIAAVLDDAELNAFHALATELGMAALVEVHDEDELERALLVDAPLIGVNQRDLHSFEVDTDRVVRVGKLIPQGVTKVAESGIKDRDDVCRLADASYDAMLIGEALVASGNPTVALRTLLGA